MKVEWKSENKIYMMTNYKYLLAFVFCLNALVFYIYNSHTPKAHQFEYSIPQHFDRSPEVQDQENFLSDAKSFPSQLPEVIPTPCPTCSYKLQYPAIASKILTQLDVYEPIPIGSLGVDVNPNEIYKRTRYGLKKDKEYCQKHREYFVSNTENFFKRKIAFGDYSDTHVLHDYLSSIVEDLNDYHVKEADYLKQIRSLPKEISLISLMSDDHRYFKTNLEFACTTQLYNHVVGAFIISRKDLVAFYSNKHFAYLSKKGCDDVSKYIPRTWHLLDKEECIDFFENHFNTDEYQRLKKDQVLVYIRKEGADLHVGRGVQPVDEAEESKIRTAYQNGKTCGYHKKNYIMQRYIHNSLLLLGHKFDFRSYLIIASTNPIIAYYADGFLRLSLFEYDPTSKNKSVLLTNAASQGYVYEEAKKGNYIANMTYEELMEMQYWDYDRMTRHLLEIGKIQSMDWVEELRNQMMKVLAHLVRITEHKIVPRSSFFEVFGVDFILDEDLNLYFLECNAVPMMMGKIDKKKEFFRQFNTDVIDMMYKYLRSRLKRIVLFVNRIIEENNLKKYQERVDLIPDMTKHTQEFKKISRNYLEPEFADIPSRFLKIVDFNLPEDKRYFSIKKECI